MKIILLKDIAKVGKKYDIKEISEGYAQNLLIPKGLAVSATPEAIKRVELEKSRDEGEKRLHHDLLLKNLNELSDKTFIMQEKANEKGHLFASIHKSEIVNTLGLQIDPEYIILEKPIKEVGIHVIEVKTAGKNIKFNLEVKPK